MKLLAFGDVQLGLHGRLDEQTHALEQIATLAYERDVDLVLNGGDTFEGPEIKPEQLDVYARFIEACRSFAIPVLMTSGNSRHDQALRVKNGVEIFGHIPGVDVSSRPDVFAYDGCVIGTLPWVHPGKLIAARGRDGELNADISDLLMDIMGDLYTRLCDLAPDSPKVLLGHWHVDTATSATGALTSLFGEALLPLSGLQHSGFDAIVLAHNHRGQLLSDEGEPPILHVGSPLAHDFGEGGFDHGCWIIDLDVSPAVAEFVPLNHRRYITLERDLVAADDSFENGWEDGLDFSGHDVTDAAVRVKFRATSEQERKLDIPAARVQLLEAGASVVKIQPDIIREQRARVSGVDEHLDELQALDLYLAANNVDETVAGPMRDRTRAYLQAAV